MLQIITDTASDITLAQAEQMGIHIVPINIHFRTGHVRRKQKLIFNVFMKG